MNNIPVNCPDRNALLALIKDLQSRVDQLEELVAGPLRHGIAEPITVQVRQSNVPEWKER